MDLDLLQQMIDQRYINVNKHPDAELYIYNYSNAVQYEQLWNEWTLQCRGLIMDADYNVVARPFRKFFNLSETHAQPIPNTPFEVYDKLDGSMGVLYFLNDQPFIATRGSFQSEQAIKANEMLYAQYRSSFQHLDPSKTYMVEIIYPQNRIVVDYGTRKELVLLGIIDTKTGEEEALKNIGFPLVKRYDALHDIDKLKDLAFENKEGFVVKFENNHRVKVKFEEYVRLHRLLTQVSSLTIWESLMDGQDFQMMLDNIPDEFYNWVRKTEAKLKANYKEIEDLAKSEFKQLATRKETASYFLTCTYPRILFAMLDEKDYSEMIWRMIRPEFEKAHSV